MPKRPTGSQDSTETRRLRMKELVEATGVSKSTILHYVNEGLLPRPEKTAANMAYYDPACIERVAFIRQMQQRHRLSLQVIRTLLEERERGNEISPFIELHEVIFGRADGPKLDLDAFCDATGLTREQVRERVAAQMIIPLEDGRFDQEDVAIGRIIRRGIELGIKPGDGEFYPRLAAQIVDHEIAIRERLTNDLSFAENARVTLALTQAARALRAYVIDRTFQRRVLERRKLGTTEKKIKPQRHRDTKRSKK